MDSQINSVVYQTWAMRITLGTTLIVVGLSWINAAKIPDLIMRGGISFGVMYLLLAGILSLFEKTAPQEPQETLEGQQSGPDAGRGGVIDFSVGEDDIGPQTPPSNFAGQVDPNLSSGLPGSEKQAEIVRRMGWD
jgi:hypothetical protein